MSKDDILHTAREAGFYDGKEDLFWVSSEGLEIFARLVAAAEREACAKLCEARYMGDNNREDAEAKRCAAAIRARGEFNAP